VVLTQPVTGRPFTAKLGVPNVDGQAKYKYSLLGDIERVCIREVANSLANVAIVPEVGIAIAEVPQCLLLRKRTLVEAEEV